MEENEEMYRREEDRKWREKVDHEQVTLMTAHQVIRDQLEDLKDRMKEVDEILRGKGNQPGLIAEYEQHDRNLTRLHAVIFQDSTGRHGLIHDVDQIKSGEMGVERRWKFVTAVAVAAITTAGLLFTNSDKIANFLGRGAKTDKVDDLIKRSKRPRGRPVIRVRVIEKPAALPAEVPDHGSDEEMP